MESARRRSIGVAVGVTLVAAAVGGWLLRRPAHVRVDAPNANVKITDVAEGDPRPVFTHALAIEDPNGWWIVLSSKPIDCATALDFEQDPYPKDKARIALDHAPATAPVEFPSEGIPRDRLCTNPSKMPEPPKTSQLTIEPSSPDRVKGRLRIDQEGVVTGPKRCLDVVKTYHWVGEGTFDAPICRRPFPWNRLP